MTSNRTNNDAYEQLFHDTAHKHFHMTPYDWQSQVGGQIIRLRNKRKPVRQLCVRPTGGGKTLLFQTLAAYMKGITLCLIPLLSLGADQVNKTMIKTRSDSTNSISAVHLDELKRDDLLELLAILNEADDGLTTILYSSPQFLVKSFPTFFAGLLATGLLRFVVVDEIHLFTHFGRSFRSEFTDLKDKVFKKLPNKVPSLFLTATCTRRIKDSFESLIGLDITHIHWPTAAEMVDRKVSLFIAYSSRPFSNMSNSIARLLKIDDNQPKKIIVYSNVRSRIKDVDIGIGEFFNKDDTLYLDDTMCIHGQLTKEEKASYTQMFLNPEHEDDKRIRVLCATSGVGNVGIDSPDIRSVFRLEFPPSLMDFSQEKGRAGRRIDADPDNFSYKVFFSIKSLIYLFERTMNPDEKYIDQTFRAEVVDDAMEVAKMITVSNKCFFLTLEDILGNPYQPVDPMNDPRTDCGRCPYCRKERLFPKLDKAGTKKLLFDIYHPRAVDGITADRVPMTLKTIVDIIRKLHGAKKLLTNSNAKGEPTPDLIKRVLFLMIASGIMRFEYHTELKKGVFALVTCGPDDSSFALQDDEYWSNIDTK